MVPRRPASPGQPSPQPDPSSRPQPPSSNGRQHPQASGTTAALHSIEKLQCRHSLRSRNTGGVPPRLLAWRGSALTRVLRACCPPMCSRAPATLGRTRPAAALHKGVCRAEERLARRRSHKSAQSAARSVTHLVACVFQGLPHHLSELETAWSVAVEADGVHLRRKL
jgi:hypothetical protein